ncbi:MAG: nucleotidyl transferase AbiEii/AbiGii toxin family protein [Deltaproteobacteria bacterium]|nr:nucleotidyl transferase AbiEii/AbiGii toxin family protein [Deltaproteobacteria bacterium]
MTEVGWSAALRAIATALTDLGRPYALVGGVATGARTQPRFTADVDVAVAVASDAEFEQLIFALTSTAYKVIATVEQRSAGRLATARLVSPSGVVVDLLAASCGIEVEIVARAEPLQILGAGSVPVARAEELLAMKVLSMTERRFQDRSDAQNLIAMNPALDLTVVRANLALIAERGFSRGEDLMAKLEVVLAAVQDE